tara:strand:- start:56 stop:1399 length:1344 start_codon:yes stop_codon:yes gene_type:complete
MGGITPFSEFNKALPPGQPGEFFIGGEKVTPPTASAEMVTTAPTVAPTVTDTTPAFDVTGFLESMIPSVDSGAFSSALEQQLATLGETEEFLTGEIAKETERRESDIQKELSIQAESLAAAYAPRYDEIQQGLQRAQESAAFGAAAAGSVRGSRAAQKQVDLAQQASKAEQALAAEQGMQLRLIEAELRGESDAVLDGLRDRMSALSSARQQVQVQLQLAEEELLATQAAIAAEVQEQQFQLLLDSLDAQGLTIDPFTGQTVTTLEGERIKSNAALTDAQTAEIYMQLQQPDLDIKYFSDEIGNTYANVFDAKTGTLETVELGRLSAAQKWAIEALNAPVVAGYAGTSGGTTATPTVTTAGAASPTTFSEADIATALLQQGMSPIEFISGGTLTELKDKGFSNEQINNIAKEMYTQFETQPSFMETLGGVASTGLQSLATPAGIPLF